MDKVEFKGKVRVTRIEDGKLVEYKILRNATLVGLATEATNRLANTGTALGNFSSIQLLNASDSVIATISSLTLSKPASNQAKAVGSLTASSTLQIRKYRLVASTNTAYAERTDTVDLNSGDSITIEWTITANYG